MSDTLVALECWSWSLHMYVLRIADFALLWIQFIGEQSILEPRPLIPIYEMLLLPRNTYWIQRTRKPSSQQS